MEKLQLHVYDHLAHHQHPSVPWLFLPHYRDPAQPRRWFWRQYWSMWKGPRPAWGESPQPEMPQPDDPDILLKPSAV
jgi:hypothetical protein